MLDQDFVDILSAFIAQKVEFIVVGAYAMAFHGFARSTGDIDLWIKCSRDNAERTWQALGDFGAPLFDLTRSDLQTPGMVFQMGLPPSRIDVITQIDGVDFDQAWEQRLTLEIHGLEIPILGKDLLIKNKRAAGRPKDLIDAGWLEGDSGRTDD